MERDPDKIQCQFLIKMISEIGTVGCLHTNTDTYTYTFAIIYWRNTRDNPTKVKEMATHS